MITAIGLNTDPTTRYFVATAARMGAAVELLDLADLVAGEWHVSLTTESESWVSTNSLRRPLKRCGAYYCRLIDLGGVCPSDRVAWRTLVSAIGNWLELCPGTVVNRPGHVNDNGCKPLHEARLAALGCDVPPSFTGCCKQDLVQFAAAGPTIAKPLSGQRADCRKVTSADFDEYDERSGPVHLQRFVEGDDVRVHVIGNEVIAVRILSSEIDYRLDNEALFEPFTVPARMNDLLRVATRAFGLDFAGWDMKVSDERCWVLEANPMPGYSYYDSKLDGSITQALIRHFDSRLKGAA